jgi:adenine-specific DNA-methyltransferase
MADLFRLDEAQALDFGIYRVIGYRNNAVRAFLGEVQAKGDHKTLVGGKLQKILDATFSTKDAEQPAQIDDRLRELEADLV